MELLTGPSRISSLPTIAVFTLLIIVSCGPSSGPKTEELTIAAAADLAPAFEELGREFEQQSRVKIIFSFGSTGMLTKQIEHGAPFDLFAAANVDFINRLDQLGLIIPESKRIYARGRITIWRQKNTLSEVNQLSDLNRAEVTRIAIANPEHAPYGLAAREAFETAGIWESVKPKLVYGENIRQTLQFAQTGNVDIAIVALSLSIPSDGDWVLIPEEMHKPLDQGLAILRTTKREALARRFSDFIFSSRGSEIMQNYGFVLP